MSSFIRAHWKRGAAIGAVCYAADYGVRRFRTWQKRALFKQQAAQIGDQPWPTEAPLPRVTVVLDVRAANRSAKGVYNGEVAPLLHLAGVAVDVVETRERGQAKETAKSLDTNGLQGVLVVGDDGTMQEFVTGWFRREDRERVRLECPLGLIPLGRHNALDASMHGHSEETVDREVHALGYLAWGVPARAVADTFNEYTRRSRWWAQLKILRDVVLAQGTPSFTAALEWKDRETGAWRQEKVDFSSLFAASVPVCRTFLVAPGRQADDGLLTLTRVPALSPLQLVRSYWALSNGESLSEAAGITSPSPSSEPGYGKGMGVEDVIVASEFKLTPLQPLSGSVAKQQHATDTNNGANTTAASSAGESSVAPSSSAAAQTQTPAGGDPSGAKAPDASSSGAEGAGAEVPLTIDGEVFESFPVHVIVNRQYLRVFA